MFPVACSDATPLARPSRSMTVGDGITSSAMQPLDVHKFTLNDWRGMLRGSRP